MDDVGESIANAIAESALPICKQLVLNEAVFQAIQRMAFMAVIRLDLIF